VSSVGDIVSGTGDMFRVGSATGEAIGSGKSGTELANAICTDVQRAGELALSMASTVKVAGIGEKAAGEVVGSKRYSAHALGQMEERGILPSVVENTLNTGARGAGKYPGTSAYYDKVNNVTVIVNDKTKVVITTRKGKP